MDKQASVEATLLFKSPFQWEVYIACRDAVFTLDACITEAFSHAAVSYAAKRCFMWLMPISRQHCLVNFDFPLEISDPLFRQQKIQHAGHYIHQMDVRMMETLTQAISRDYLKLALSTGREGVHGKA